MVGTPNSFFFQVLFLVRRPIVISIVIDGDSTGNLES